MSIDNKAFAAFKKSLVGKPELESKRYELARVWLKKFERPVKNKGSK